MAEPVALSPCPKCGSADTTMRWHVDFCDAANPYRRITEHCPGNGSGEHFARECQRCLHQWATNDVRRG